MNRRERAEPAWRGISGLLVLILVLAACTSNEAVSRQTAATSTPTIAESESPQGTTEMAPSERPFRPGRLVILDEADEVVVVDPDGTNAGVLGPDREGRAFFQPIWSPDGRRVAAGYADSDGAGLAVLDATGGDMDLVQSASMPFYIYWSPDGRRVGFLNNGPEAGLDMTVLDTTTGEATVFGRGAPFYFSWAPDGRSIATHVDGETMEIRSLDNSVRSLDSPGFFQAPQWTQSGLFHLGVPAGGEQQLLLTGDETRGVGLASISELQGVTAALQTVPRLPVNRLLVIDVSSGTWDIVSDESFGAFFWSPDGERLLLIGSGDTAGSLRWSVWDGSLTAFESFLPSPGFVLEFLPFFDQYAQSMTLWSPDGEAFAYPAMTGGIPGIWIQDIDGTDPIRLTDGSWVSWSTQDPPLPSG
jgi:TolB protein